MNWMSRPPQVAPASDAEKLPRTRPVSSKHLDGISDLVVAAPIKQGFINAFEHVTYETRLRIVMETLTRMRTASREFNLLKPLLDTTELIQSIESFRLSIVELETAAKIEKRLVLSVTFDRPWEPYIRLIWNPLGRVLDVLFCNCEFYVPATDSSFEDFARWIREYQVDTGFFYSASKLSVTDWQYLVQVDRLHRNTPAADVEVEAATICADNPIEVAARVRADEPAESDMIALEALGALYRLTSYYPTDREDSDGKYLHRAAHSLLKGWTFSESVPREDYANWLKWLEDDFGHATAYAGTGVADQDCDPRNLQAGIVSGYDKRQGRMVTHGCLLLLHVDDPDRGRKFVGDLIDEITTEATTTAKDGLQLNIAFTHRGLQSLEVPAVELRKFPQEFLEGPEKRAGLFGDVMANHPRRWRLPKRNWPTPSKRNADVPALPVDLSEIDIVVQLRTASDHKGHDVFDQHGELDLDDPQSGKTGHPLAATVQSLADRAAKSRVRLLSVQPMRSRPVPPEEIPEAYRASGSVTQEHFGFFDGFSQPVVDPDAETDRVSRGEMLLGYSNDRGDRAADRNPWLDDGSFLVVRKIGQNVRALRDWAKAQCGNGSAPSEAVLYEKMMGRTAKGELLFKPSPSSRGPNDFSYDDDAASACPMQSHVRRANPRISEHDRPAPRIMRRGMSYGPRFDDEPEAERGLVFMCYQSSIAEQYEVVQRWLNGGNSTNIGSAQNDPLTGVVRPGEPRTFRWADGEKVFRVNLDAKPASPAAQRAPYKKYETDENQFVTLEWLLYLFTPSIAGIRKIAHEPRFRGDDELDVGEALLVELGDKLIHRLQLGERLLDAVEKFKPLQPVLPGWYHDPGWAEYFRRWAYVLLYHVPRLLWNGFREVVLRWPPRHLEHIGEAARNWKALLEDLGAKDPSERAYGPAVWAAIRANHGGVIRVPYGDPVSRKVGNPVSPKPIEWVVLVASHKLAMQVYDNRRGLYSVEGRGERLERMEGSLGKIYVGVDESADYYAESKLTNRILMARTEREAFEVARRIADGILDGCLAASPAGTIARLDLTDHFVTPALAEICTHWFGIPDPQKDFVEKGSWIRLASPRDFDPAGKARCPGDFTAPSRYIFYPDPNPAVQDYGKQLGMRLRARVTEMYTRMYCEGRVPKNGHGQDAKIAAEMFSQIVGTRTRTGSLTRKERRKIDLLARNVIGAMVGMLPPTDGNIRGALYGWLKDRTLWRVQETLLSAASTLSPSDEDPDEPSDAKYDGPYARAVKGLRKPLMEAMCLRPAPDMVWRTATRRHWLGDDFGKRVKVRRGEKIFIGIVSATMEDNERSEPDVYPIFGGKRCPFDEASGRQPAPLHACPGYAIAMGTMLGIISALLEKGSLKALPTPLMVELRR